MKNPLNIKDLVIWDRVLNEAEVNMLYNPDKKYYKKNDVISNHICISTEWEKGFWNHLFLKRRQTIYINGVENISWTIKKSTISWWNKSKLSELTDGK